MSAPKNPVTCQGCQTATHHTAMVSRTLVPDSLNVKCCPTCNRVLLVKSGSSWKKA